MGLARMVLTRNQGSHDGRARLHHGAGTRVTFLRTPVGTAPADPIHERWTRATWPSPSDRPPTRQTSSHASAANEPTKEGTVHLSDPRLPPEREARHLARIRAYYDETWLDYRWLWLNRHNYALHFGYWDAHTRTHAAALLNLNRVLARALAIRPGQRILDAGCGVGGSAIWLAQTFGAEVVGITPVPSQVDRARRHARATGVADRVTFEQQDYTHTTFPDRSFDYVWAIESVCHAPDKRAVLREARRVLRPGGRLGVIEYVRTGRPHAPADERLLQRWLSDWAIPIWRPAQSWCIRARPQVSRRCGWWILLARYSRRCAACSGWRRCSARASPCSTRSDSALPASMATREAHATSTAPRAGASGSTPC